ncbi:MAG: hypothetical protein KKE55_04840, partial [Candidatus Omnitrophica bacterium]|nr:hypothetical protein [Candidatus Omnitrophota bacterium]
VKQKDINAQGCQVLLDSLFSLRDNKTGLEEAFREEREVMKNQVRSISKLPSAIGRLGKDYFQKFHKECDRLADKVFGYYIRAFKENRPEVYEKKFCKIKRDEFVTEKNSINFVGKVVVEIIRFQSFPPPTLAASALVSANSFPALAIMKYYLSLSELDILITAVAIKFYEIKKGKVPDSLQELIPIYLSKLPQDPFDDFKPLKYKKRDKGFIVYSFGPDRKDDQGSIEYSIDNPENGGDIIFSSY